MRTADRKGLSYLLLCFGLVVAVMVMAAPQPQGNFNPSTDGTLAVASSASVPEEIVWSETVTLKPYTTQGVVVPGDHVACSWQNTTNSTNFFDYDAAIAIYAGVRSSPDEQFMNAATGELKHFSRAAPWVGANCASKNYSVCDSDLPSTNNRRGTKLNC